MGATTVITVYAGVSISTGSVNKKGNIMVDKGKPKFGNQPLWIVNIAVFTLLIIFMLGFYLYQIQHTTASLKKETINKTKQISTIIEQQFKQAIAANRSIDQLVKTTLAGKAEFTAYLDSIEPLNSIELEELAIQSGLTGISLQKISADIVTTSSFPLDTNLECSKTDDNIRYQNNIVYLAHPVEHIYDHLKCVISIMDATDILAIKEKQSLSSILESLTKLPEIVAIEIKAPGTGFQKQNEITLITDKNDGLIKTSFTTSQGVLEIIFSSHNFKQQRHNLLRQFIWFSCFLALAGLLFSWILYLYQRRQLKHLVALEKIMAKEQEDALLGRATATIAHEIKNPLNAISMGMQRLQIENDKLDKEEKELIGSMLSAIERTSSIIKKLQRFTGKLQIKEQPVSISTIIKEQVALYKPLWQKQGIAVATELAESVFINGDKELLAELIENTLKNSLEAQQDGGIIKIILQKEQDRAVISISNEGFCLSQTESKKIGQPYFTTKTQGSGLGLTMCKKIVAAHRGSMEIIPRHKENMFIIKIFLPIC